MTVPNPKADMLAGCVAQLAERQSLAAVAGELTLYCARPAADGWPLTKIIIIIIIIIMLALIFKTCNKMHTET